MENLFVSNVFFDIDGDIALVEFFGSDGENAVSKYKEFERLTRKELAETEKFLQKEYKKTLPEVYSPYRDFAKEAHNYLPEDQIETPAAKGLPWGWFWVKYPDGSGHLRAPNEESYFSYDISTNEAKDIYGYWQPENEWDTFWERKEKEISHYLETEFPANHPTATKRLGCGISVNLEVFVGSLDLNKTARYVERAKIPYSVKIDSHVLRIIPRQIETSYEFFEDYHEIWFDGEILWGAKGRSVGPHAVIPAPIGKFIDEWDAVQYIREKIK